VEHSGLTPPGAVVAADLAQVVARPGPFASVYLSTEAEIDNASQRSQTRWKTLRRDLEGAGVPEEILAGVEEVIGDAHLSGQALGVVADAGGRLVEHSPEPLPRDRATWAPAPALVPIIAWRQSSPPCLAVLADRTGADLLVFRHELPDVQREAGGEHGPVTRAGPGGWSQPRYQRRAENTWEHNAGDVAAEVVALVERFEPRVIVVAGDVRAVELLRGQLPSELAARLKVVEGGRAEDGSHRHFMASLRQLVDEAVDADTAALLGKFAQELGQSDRAADGPEAVLAALARGQVEVLLAADQADDERLAYFGPEPTQVGRSQADVAAMGAEDPQEAPLVDVAVRAALGTGAGVRVVPPDSGPTGGLGAILRWSS
jgi:hypothetical protein